MSAFLKAAGTAAMMGFCRKSQAKSVIDDGAKLRSSAGVRRVTASRDRKPYNVKELKHLEVLALAIP